DRVAPQTGNTKPEGGMARPPHATHPPTPPPRSRPPQGRACPPPPPPIASPAAEAGDAAVGGVRLEPAGELRQRDREHARRTVAARTPGRRAVAATVPVTRK